MPDATIVRLVVPAAMFPLGKVNWSLPRRLDRVLPHREAEGRPREEAEPAPVA